MLRDKRVFGDGRQIPWRLVYVRVQRRFTAIVIKKREVSKLFIDLC